jgi:hypothetical protein
MSACCAARDLSRPQDSSSRAKGGQPRAGDAREEVDDLVHLGRRHLRVLATELHLLQAGSHRWLVCFRVRGEDGWERAA